MWFNFDPCGLVCAFITHLLLVYAQYVVTYVILLPWFEMSIQGMLHQIGTLLAVAVSFGCNPQNGIGLATNVPTVCATQASHR